MGIKILCTIDFSDSSIQALRWAIMTAQQQKAHLTILYVYRLTKPEKGEVIEMKKKIEVEAARNIAILEKELMQGQGITYDFRTEVGFVADRIEDYAKKNTVSCLVMDKAMSTGNKETFGDLIEHIKVPLVIVP